MIKTGYIDKEISSDLATLILEQDNNLIVPWYYVDNQVKESEDKGYPDGVRTD